MIVLTDATETFDKIQKKPPPFMDKKKKSQQNRDSEKLLKLIKNNLQLSFSFMVRN